MKRSSPQKKFSMGYVKMHGFHDNLLYADNLHMQQGEIGLCLSFNLVLSFVV